MTVFTDSQWRYLCALKDSLRDTFQGYNPHKLRIQVICHLEYRLVHEKVIIHSSLNEEEVRKVYEGITGKAYTRDIAIDRSDFDS